MSRRSVRSQHGLAGSGKNAVVHRRWMQSRNLAEDALDARPVPGICMTVSGLAPCNADLPGPCEDVEAGRDRRPCGKRVARIDNIADLDFLAGWRGRAVSHASH